MIVLQELGMFMSCLSVVGTNGNDIERSCKSSILEFKWVTCTAYRVRMTDNVLRSGLLRTMETLVFSPFLLTGTTTQRQWLRIVFFEEFYNDPSNLASQIRIQLQSQFVQVFWLSTNIREWLSPSQIYSSKLTIQAELSGLRYVMHYHPWISSLSGILANIAVLSIIILISWSRWGIVTNIFISVSTFRFFSPETEMIESQVVQLNQETNLSDGVEMTNIESLDGHLATDSSSVLSAR